MIAEPKASLTLQVEFNGTRLTAHYEMKDFEFEFTQYTSNVENVPVLLATQLALLQQAFDMGRQT